MSDTHITINRLMGSLTAAVRQLGDDYLEDELTPKELDAMIDQLPDIIRRLQELWA